MCSIFIVPIMTEWRNVHFFYIMKWVHVQNLILYFLFVVPVVYRDMMDIVMYHYYISLLRMITLVLCLPILMISNLWCAWNQDDVYRYGDVMMIAIVLCQWYIIVYFAFPDFCSNVVVTGSDWMDSIPTCLYSHVA